MFGSVYLFVSISIFFLLWWEYLNTRTCVWSVNLFDSISIFLCEYLNPHTCVTFGLFLTAYQFYLFIFFFFLVGVFKPSYICLVRLIVLTSYQFFF